MTNFLFAHACKITSQAVGDACHFKADLLESMICHNLHPLYLKYSVTN